MIRRAILFTGYRFTILGNDHMESHDWNLQRELGKGVAYPYNKRGGLMYIIFPGDPSEDEITELIKKIEVICNFKYYDSKEEQYQAQYELNLKSMFGDKLVIKE